MTLDHANVRVDNWQYVLNPTLIKHGDFVISLTFSAGNAVYPDHGADPDTLLDSADDALSRSNSDGRNGVTSFK